MEKLFILALLIQTLVPFIVLFIMFRRRISAVKNRDVSVKYFRTYQGEHKLPEAAVAASRHFSNQFEMPTIFFVIALLSLYLKQVDLVVVILAWLFVLLRLMHSFVHLGKNNVIHRMNLFGLSCLVLVVHIIYLGGKIFLFSK